MRSSRYDRGEARLGDPGSSSAHPPAAPQRQAPATAGAGRRPDPAGRREHPPGQGAGPVEGCPDPVEGSAPGAARFALQGPLQHRVGGQAEARPAAHLPAGPAGWVTGGEGLAPRGGRRAGRAAGLGEPGWTFVRAAPQANPSRAPRPAHQCRPDRGRGGGVRAHAGNARAAPGPLEAAPALTRRRADAPAGRTPDAPAGRTPDAPAGRTVTRPRGAPVTRSGALRFAAQPNPTLHRRGLLATLAPVNAERLPPSGRPAGDPLASHWLAGANRPPGRSARARARQLTP